MQDELFPFQEALYQNERGALRRVLHGDLCRTTQSWTWCPLRSDKKIWRARNTASISMQLMCSPSSAFDQWPKIGLPLHRAPQPLLETSVKTTFLLHTIPRTTPCSIHWEFFQGARAVTHKCAWCHAWDVTRSFSKYCAPKHSSRKCLDPS